MTTEFGGRMCEKTRLHAVGRSFKDSSFPFFSGVWRWATQIDNTERETWPGGTVAGTRCTYRRHKAKTVSLQEHQFGSRYAFNSSFLLSLRSVPSRQWVQSEALTKHVATHEHGSHTRHPAVVM